MTLHINSLDPYQHGHSPLHQLDPRIKLVIALGFILTSSLTPPGAWAVYILLMALVMSAILFSELGFGFTLKRALILSSPFVLAVLPLPFTVAGSPIAQIPLGFATLTISQPGVIRFVSILLKSWISVQAAILLASTTQFPDLLIALRALRLPPLLVSVIGLMWRYLFVMADETLRMLRARSARSSTSADAPLKPGGKLTWRAPVTGGVAGSLFLRSIERSDRIYAAMLSRGYDGETRALPLPPIPASAWVVFAASMLTFAFLLFLGQLF